MKVLICLLVTFFTIQVILADFKGSCAVEEALCECSNGENAEAVCRGGGLEVIPHDLDAQLTSLDLSYNRILKLDNVAMYPSLRTFKINHNNLTEVGLDCFKHNKELTTLDLSYNSLSELNKDTFLGLYSLITIDLSDNQISSIKEDSFTPMSSLQILNLASNSLQILDNQAFSMSHRNTLHQLDLSHNYFSGFPFEALTALKNLRKLHIGENGLKYIGDKAFSSFKYLSELRLNECGLDKLGELAFAGLDTLESLDISGNNFAEIPEVALNIPSLETINIGGNLFDSLNSSHLTKLSRLKHFNMHDCQAVEVRLEEGVFHKNLDLTSINITRCDLIDPVDSVKLYYLHKLEHVNLHGNLLTTLRQDLLPMTDLISLDLSGNPISCDCHLKWLRNWPIHNPNIKLKAGCVYGDDRPSLISLDVEEFKCGPESYLIIILSAIGGAIGLLIIGLVVFCLFKRHKRNGNACQCSKISLPDKNRFILRRPWKGKNQKPRLSRNYSGKQDIKVVPNEIENGGKFIDLNPGLQNTQDSSEEDESSHLYDTVAFEDSNANFPDVKVTQI